MSNLHQPHIPTERAIDPFDEAIGRLSGLAGGADIRPSTVQSTTPIVGRTDTFIVQSIRHEIGKDKHDEPVFGVTQFIQRVSAEGVVRLVIPPKVSALLAAQRDAITVRIRKRAAQQAVQTRRDRGDTLGNPAALRKARRARRAK